MSDKPYSDDNSFRDNDQAKFTDGSSGKVAERVYVDGGLVDIDAGMNIPPHDTINATYPTSTTEVYTYLLSAVTVATITVTYSTAAKKILLSVVKS